MSRLQDTLALLAKHPGAIEGLLVYRTEADGTRDLPAFVQDVVEDAYWEADDKLWASDGESYTIWWDAENKIWQVVA